MSLWVNYPEYDVYDEYVPLTAVNGSNYSRVELLQREAMHDRWQVRILPYVYSGENASLLPSLPDISLLP